MRRFLWLLLMGCGVLLASGCEEAVSDAVDVGVGDTAACLLNDAGGVECWGAFYDQNGLVYGGASVPIPVSSLSSGASAIELGGNHACAIVSGIAKCWGANDFGQLGIGTTSPTGLPTAVTGFPAGTTVEQISAYRDHTCARLNTGAVWCWGHNFLGQLGNGTNVDSSTPVVVTGLDGTPGQRAIDVAAGAVFTCAARPNGLVGCWGSDFRGELGNGAGQTDSNVPMLVPGLTDVIGLEAGNDHVCALRSVGTIGCWGDNSHSAIAAGGGFIESPVPMSNFPGPGSGFATGNGRHCVVLGSGIVECVGYGGVGALGDGNNSDSSTAVQVVGTDVSPVALIDINDSGACVVGVDGDIRCWGPGAEGQLGTWDTSSSYVPATVIRGLA